MTLSEVLEKLDDPYPPPAWVGQIFWVVSLAVEVSRHLARFSASENAETFDNAQ
jgi:hypothetical protein